MVSMTRLAKIVGGCMWAFAWLALAIPATPVYAVESGNIGGRPAFPDANNARTNSIFLFSLAPGKAAENAVRIYNSTSEKKQIDVYAVDSQVSSGGAFACTQKADVQKAAGTWVKLNKQSVTLSPSKTETIPFTVSVPKDTPAGEHNACIAIQEANQTPQSAGNGIALSFRSAIRVAITVEGDVKKGLILTSLDTHLGKDDKRIVTVSLKNNGNVSLDTYIDVRIKSIFGTTTRQTGGEYPVLAGSDSELNFETTDPFWGGFYFLDAKASYNDDPKASLGDKNKAAHERMSRLIVTAPRPLALVIELGLVAALLAGLILRRKRRKHTQAWSSQGTIHTVVAGDNIQKIAKMHNQSWKKVARMNGIKAPYNLEEGQRIKILPKQSQPKKKSKVVAKAKNVVKKRKG